MCNIFKTPHPISRFNIIRPFNSHLPRVLTASGSKANGFH